MIFGWILILCGIAVIAGWVFNIEWLLSPLPGPTVTMKFLTAAMFILAGIGAVSRRMGSMLSEVVAISAYTAIFLLSIISLFGVLTPFAADDTSFQTVAAGVPSIGTMIAFCVCAVIGSSRASHGSSFPGGFIVIAMGALALMGHGLAIPALYFYSPDISTGMAIHTGALFLVAGLELESK